MRISDTSKEAKQYMSLEKGVRTVGPHGNLGRVDPGSVARQCDEAGIPWWTSAWPYSSGIHCYVPDDELWNKIRTAAKY